MTSDEQEPSQLRIGLRVAGWIEGSPAECVLRHQVRSEEGTEAADGLCPERPLSAPAPSQPLATTLI
jgi:hypothetical protein